MYYLKYKLEVTPFCFSGPDMVIAVAKILDIVHYLEGKPHNVSEAKSASVFRWNTKRGEPNLVVLLEVVSLYILNFGHDYN
jgi:hypothetical protein